MTNGCRESKARNGCPLVYSVSELPLKHTRIGFKSLVYRLDNEYMKPFDHLKESKCLSNNQNLKMKVTFLSLSENKISAEETNYSGKLPLRLETSKSNLL